MWCTLIVVPSKSHWRFSKEAHDLQRFGVKGWSTVRSHNRKKGAVICEGSECD